MKAETMDTTTKKEVHAEKKEKTTDGDGEDEVEVNEEKTERTTGVDEENAVQDDDEGEEERGVGGYEFSKYGEDLR